MPDSPQPGAPAPDFTLPSSTGADVSLSGLRGRRVVVFFYPKADTPGCTKEACGFRDSAADYAAADAVVLGVSPDPVVDVKAFADKFSLDFPLLADADHAVCERYGVWREKSLYGKTVLGAARTTFVIAADGTVERVYEKVKPEGHDREVLEGLRAGG